MTVDTVDQAPRQQMALDPFHPRDTVDGWAHMLVKVEQLARAIASTEFVLPALRGKPAAVTAAILAGRELGVGPMTALQQIHVIEGRPSMSALLMRALVQAHGHRLRIITLTANACTLVGGRLGEDDNPPVTYTMADARTAELDRKPTWRKYPRAMLLARCTGELCRAVFADVVVGMPYTAEELGASPDDLAVEAAPAAPDQGTGQTVQRTVAAPESTSPAAMPPSRQPAAAIPEPDLPGDQGEPAGVKTESYEQRRREAEATRQRALDRARAEKGTGTRAARGVDAATQQPERGIQDTPLPADTPPAAEVGEEEHAAGDGPATQAQQRNVFRLLKEIYGDDLTRDRRMHIAQGILARRVTSFAQVTVSEASALIDTFARCQGASDPAGSLDWLVESGHEHLRLVESGEQVNDAQVVQFAEAEVVEEQDDEPLDEDEAEVGFDDEDEPR